MNDLFNFRRFVIALKRLFFEKGMKLLASLCLVFSIIAMLLQYIAMINPREYSNTREIVLAFSLVLGPILYVWIISDEHASESKSIAYLLTPFSVLERWLLHVVVGLSAYFSLMISGYKIIDIWIVSGIHDRISSSQTHLQKAYVEVLQELTAFSFEPIFYIPLFLGIIISLTIYIGTVYFKKNVVFYSLITLTVVFLIFFGIHFFVAELIFGEELVFEPRSVFPFGSLVIKPQNTLYRTYNLEPIWTLKKRVFIVFVPIVAMISGIYYRRLKEKQL